MARTPPGDPAPIRLELENEWAWCGARRLDLPPKVFAVLRHLVEHPQRLITKDELLSVVWGQTVVSEAALTSCVRDLRKALGDASQRPRYIETVHRRGFRFIGPLAMPASPAATRPPTAPSPAAPFVGRDDELDRLQDLFAAAAAGRRQVVFVTGEPGIGKTTLVEAFLARLGVPGLRVGRGQCVEQYGAGEAYLPVLEALGRLGREPDGPALVRILKQYAPTWLAQLPALLADDELDAVQRRAAGASRERMLREVCDAIDAVSSEAPFALVLEDLHWSDSATVELLAMLARRRDPAHLLIVGTYRPADVAASAHPLESVKNELGVHGWCEEVALGFLGEDAVDAYLASRFPDAQFPPEFARHLHENTGGNALFLVNLVDDVVAQGFVGERDGRWTLSVPLERAVSGIPHSLAQMIERQIERLAPAEQAVLGVGSVAGMEFSAALSTIDGIAADDADRVCNALARRGQLVRATGTAEWPDGTIAGRYAFIHALYRNALYGRIPVGHRVGQHLRIGARLEQAHGARSADVAGELAMHFEHGRDFERAVRYRRQAADTALRQHAYRQAVDHATQALTLLSALPDSLPRAQQELPIQTVRAAAVIATQGWAAPEVEEAYGRAREICTRLGDAPQLFPVLLGLCGFYLMRGEMPIARDISAQLLALGETMRDDAVMLGASNMAGLVAFYGGDFVGALARFDRARAIYDPERHSPGRLQAFSVDHDAGISCGAHTAWTLSTLGYADRAGKQMRECLERAQTIDHPVSLVMACNFAASFYHFRGDYGSLRAVEALRVACATEHEFDIFIRLGEVYTGLLAVEDGRAEEGLEQIRRGVAIHQFAGAALGTPTFLGMLAVACHGLGHTDDARAAVRDALALSDRTDLRYWDAELWRLDGTLRSDASEAESCFLTALDIARRQQAKAHELRAATSLARLWQRQRKIAKARALLDGILPWFTEGMAMPDLVEATALRAELERPRAS